MNREIKFRAWDTFNKRMVYDPYYFRDNFDKGLSHEPEWQVPYQFAEQWQDVDDGIWRPCQIMQFTGLKDKNGKEIYEGDIVQFDTWSKKGVKEVVQFEDGAFMPFFDPHYCDDEQGDHFNDDTIGVIGNIFEHPELIKVIFNPIVI